MCSGLFDTLPLNELTCMGSKGSLFSLWKMQLENATALFVVEVYCSRAKSKVVLRSEFAAEWTHYGLRTRTVNSCFVSRAIMALVCVHLAITDNSCPAKQRTFEWKRKEIAIGVTDTFGRVPGAQFYVPLRTATCRFKLSKPLPGFLFISI